MQKLAQEALKFNTLWVENFSITELLSYLDDRCWLRRKVDFCTRCESKHWCQRWWRRPIIARDWETESPNADEISNHSQHPLSPAENDSPFYYDDEGPVTSDDRPRIGGGPVMSDEMVLQHKAREANQKELFKRENGLNKDGEVIKDTDGKKRKKPDKQKKFIPKLLQCVLAPRGEDGSEGAIFLEDLALEECLMGEMEHYYEKIAQFVKERRNHVKFTPEAFAVAIGITVKELQTIEFDFPKAHKRKNTLFVRYKERMEKPGKPRLDIPLFYRMADAIAAKRIEVKKQAYKNSDEKKEVLRKAQEVHRKIWFKSYTLAVAKSARRYTLFDPFSTEWATEDDLYYPVHLKGDVFNAKADEAVDAWVKELV